MRKRIEIFLICMLLISSTTSLALTPFNRNDQQMKDYFFDTKPVLLPQSKGWMKTFGGTEIDYGLSVQQTTDGGYIITGVTSSFGAGGKDVWLIKTDSSGKKIWDKTFGGIDEDGGRSVQQTNDGGYIITGTTNSSGAGLRDAWLIKTDANGYETWNKTFGGIGNDEANSVQQTTDGGYIITGLTDLFEARRWDVWLIKIDANGYETWNKTFGGIDYDFGNSVQQTSDGGYIIVGYTGSFGAGHYDIWLIKTDANGDKVWDKTIGGTNTDGGISVQQTTDGGYIITGNTFTFGAGDCDIWLIKTDANGDKVWDKTFGGIDGDGCQSVQQTSDGGYIMIGGTYSFGAGDCDIWLIKTDNNGNEKWNRTFGGTNDDWGQSVQQTNDGGFIITGVTNASGLNIMGGDVWLIKTDSQGKSKTISLGSLLFEKLVQRFPFFEKILNQ